MNKNPFNMEIICISQIKDTEILRMIEEKLLGLYVFE